MNTSRTGQCRQGFPKQLSKTDRLLGSFSLADTGQADMQELLSWLTQNKQIFQEWHSLLGDETGLVQVDGKARVH